MLLDIHADNPDKRKIDQVVERLEKGGIIIYPTDTVYGIGCDIFNKKAVEKIYQIRGLNPKKARLSFICESISQIAEYSAQIENEIFRLMKQILPGPYTIILKGNHKVPKIMVGKRSTIGVRIPDNEIALEIVRKLGRPILTASLKADNQIKEYFSTAEEIYDDFGKLVDVVIDGGPGNNQPSTVIDCTVNPPELIRQGAGEILW